MIYQCISIFSRWNINFIITSTLFKPIIWKLIGFHCLTNYLFFICEVSLLRCQTMFLKWMQFGIHIYNFLLKYMLGSLLILISKSWGCPPHPWAGHAFLRQRHMRRGEGGYLFMPGFSSLYDAIHGWMMGRTDRWMDGSCDEKSFTKNDHNVLYYM